MCGGAELFIVKSQCKSKSHLLHPFLRRLFMLDRGWSQISNANQLEGLIDIVMGWNCKGVLDFAFWSSVQMLMGLLPFKANDVAFLANDLPLGEMTCRFPCITYSQKNNSCYYFPKEEHSVAMDTSPTPSGKDSHLERKGLWCRSSLF